VTFTFCAWLDIADVATAAARASETRIKLNFRFIIVELLFFFGSRDTAQAIIMSYHTYYSRTWRMFKQKTVFLRKTLAKCVNPSRLGHYGIRPQTIWIGETSTKGYLEADFSEVFRRYIPKSVLEKFIEEATEPNRQREAPAGSEGAANGGELKGVPSVAGCRFNTFLISDRALGLRDWFGVRLSEEEYK
jgi:hypothetical protein